MMDRTRTVGAQTREKVESLHVAAAAEPSVVASRTAVCQHRSVKIAALKSGDLKIRLRMAVLTNTERFCIIPI